MSFGSLGSGPLGSLGGTAPPPSEGGPSADALLLESGDFELLESGDFQLLEG